jgi:DNA-binding protein HU-beta
VNKAELIEALAARLGDRKAATTALDAVLTEVQAAVTKGDRVAITGFGVFEKRVRGARTARNPRTGEAVKVKKTSVPTFRPGTGFKDMVASGRVPKTTVTAKKTVAGTKAAPVRKAAAGKAAAPAKKTAAGTKAAPVRKAAAGKAAAPAKKTAAAKATATKAAPAKKTAKKAAPAKTTTRATAARKAPAKKAPAKKAAARR